LRIILYTGKGGVGKTSVAAATALRAAAMGHRTIILSTDAAHSLADSLDQPLTSEPSPVAPNLWGQEVDIYHEIEMHWGTLQTYMTSVLSWRGVEGLVAEELTAFPGMEELASLLRIVQYHDEGKYDTIIVDCAPTGETLRLLSFPDVVRWYLSRIFPIQRSAARLMRPVIRPFIDLPLPDDNVFGAIEDLLKQLDRMNEILSDPVKSSVRLVLNPEKMVVKEAQRTYTYLNLYGYHVDAVVSNRHFPTSLSDHYFDSWKESQVRQSALVDESFYPLPILRVPLFDQEVLGREMLVKLADTLFGDGDPARLLYTGKPHAIEKTAEGYVLTLPLPLVRKEAVDMTRTGDELIIRIGNFKRNVILPRALAALEVSEARFDGSDLRIGFAKGGADAPAVCEPGAAPRP
jgi:arsenite/tail-anchored protein-transporting ATPase